MLEYKFNGVFNKNILNGTYECLDDCEIESGTISLKVVNENFLCGVTTYISAEANNDDVIQSPYALFRNTTNNLGTFNLCRKCVNARARIKVRFRVGAKARASLNVRLGLGLGLGLGIGLGLGLGPRLDLMLVLGLGKG